jgi:uncharacterized protein with FMN-binding domain
MIGWFIALVIVAGLGIAGGIGWSKLMKEHREARSLPLNAVNFSKLHDGTYQGGYAGGMYKWRANECQVTVSSGKVTEIQLVGSQDPGAKNTQHQQLYDRVIQAQSLQVDTISGATLTSKAYLKAVENALVPAQHEQGLEFYIEEK